MAKRRRAANNDDDSFDWVLAPWDWARELLGAAWSSVRSDNVSKLFLLVFAFALFSRLIRPDWYSNRLFHPDERWIFDRTAELSVWAEPGKSDPAGMQYGSLPLYATALVKDTVRLMNKQAGAHPTTMLAGRTLTGLVDSLTVLLTFLLGALLFSRWVGLLAAALVAFSPLHMQLAHFFTVDPWMTCASVATLFASAKVWKTGSWKWSLVTGVAYAAALACKTSALPLVASILLAHFARAAEPALDSKARRHRLLEALKGSGIAALATLGGFIVFMPWALIHFSKFVANQTAQRDILVVGSPGGVPYVRQYWDTGILFHLKNIVFFYLGVPAGLLGLLGLAYYGLKPALELGGVLGAKAPAAPLSKRPAKKAGGSWPSFSIGTLLLVAWIVPYFMIVGFSFAKFARYMLPVLPMLALLAAALLQELGERLPARRGLVKFGALLVLLVSLGYGLGYAATYFREHPWIAASKWMFSNIPQQVNTPGGPRRTRILNEDWGDDLPVEVEGKNAGFYDGLKGRPGQVNIVEWDSPNKLARLATSLEQTDYLVLADPRAYGTYLRLPTRFPLTFAYYDLLFSEPAKLGFERVYEGGNSFSVFGLTVPDKRTPGTPRWLWADESFTLYDRPYSFLFKRVGSFNAQQLMEVLTNRVKEKKLPDAWTRGQSPEESHRLASGGPVKVTSSGGPERINPNYGRSRGALFKLGHPVLAWWLIMLVLGWLAVPLALALFPSFPAGGYALAKTLGLFVFSILTYNLVWLGRVPFHQSALWLFLGALSAGGALAFWRHKAACIAWVRANRLEIYWSEGLFLGAFLFFVGLRSLNPNIHDIAGPGYFGGGEPLGMTYLSAVSRAATFPMYDPWLALKDSSYYYFGYVIVGTLTKLSGFAPSITYNLSLALFFSLALQAAYGLGRALSQRRGFALAGAAAVALFGTLWGLGHVAMQTARGGIANGISAWFSHAFIWDPTRFPEQVNGMIFEFPYFSYLYGDLHPHNMVVAFGLVLTALFLVPFKSALAGWRSVGATWKKALLWVGVTAVLLDAQFAINTWNWPVFAALGAGALLLGPWAGKHLSLGKGLLASLQGLGLFLLIMVLGRVAMHGFRAYFIQDSGQRLGWVVPNEWQMGDYIPLAFFGFGFAALGVLAGLRLRKILPGMDKSLGLSKLFKRSWLDGISDLPERVMDKAPIGGSALLVGLLLITACLGASLAHVGRGGVIWLGLGLGFSCLLFFCLRGYEDGEEAFLWLLGGFTAFLVAGTEWIFVADRMNTIFKFWFNGWVLMGIVFGAGFARAVHLKAAPVKATKSRRSRLPRATVYLIAAAAGVFVLLFGAAFLDARMLGMGGRFGLSVAVLLAVMLSGLMLAWPKLDAYPVARGAFVALLVAGSLYPVGASVARLAETQGFRKPRLDGLAFMREREPRLGTDAKDYDKFDAELIGWLNANADKVETLVEAPGIEMYKGYSRYAIYTGLPTLLGWDYQVSQQLGGRTGNILTERKQEAQVIYGADEAAARVLMDRFKVRWVVVGNIERRLYGPEGLAKFERFCSVAAKSGTSVLYRYDGAAPVAGAKPGV